MVRLKTEHHTRRSTHAYFFVARHVAQLYHISRFIHCTCSGSRLSHWKLPAGHGPKDVHSTVQKEPRETAGRTQSEAPSLSNAEKVEGSFQVDLRVHGVSQDDIYKDEERMTEMQNLVDRLQDGYRDKSIIKDLKQEGVSNVFSGESKRKLKVMGNIELYDLSEIVITTQCPFSLKHSKEGTIYCGCGSCLIPSQEHEGKIRRTIKNNRHSCRSSARCQARKTGTTPWT